MASVGGGGWEVVSPARWDDSTVPVCGRHCQVVRSYLDVPGVTGLESYLDVPGVPGLGSYLDVPGGPRSWGRTLTCRVS